MRKQTRLSLRWISLGLTMLTLSVWSHSHAASVRAKRIINDRDMWDFSHDHDYFWRSNHQLLYHRMVDGYGTKPGEGWMVVNVTNRTSLLLKALSGKHFEDYDGEEGGNALLSPDGMWLLSFGFAGTDEYGGMYGDLSRVDGSHHRQLHPIRYADICWLDDSLHWVEWDSATATDRYHRVRIHSVNNNMVEEIRVPWRGGLNGDVNIRDGRLVSPEHLLMLLPIDRREVDAAGFLRIGEWNLRHPAAMTRKYKIPVGKGADIAELRLSSGGKQVACLYRSKNRRRWRIQVSNLEGTKGHDVAGLPLVSGNREFAIEQLDWSPDGKQLSFVYDNAVWVVPAD